MGMTFIYGIRASAPEGASRNKAKNYFPPQMEVSRIV